MQTKLIKCLLILTTSFLLSACGYQLKGTGQSSLNSVAVALQSNNIYGTFEKQLLRRLKAQQANVVAGEQADYQLEVLEINDSEQGVSRDATGRANEAILTVEVKFRWINLKPAVSQQEQSLEPAILTIAQSAPYVFDYRDPVARKNQQRETKLWLYQQVSEQVVHYIERKSQL